MNPGPRQWECGVIITVPPGIPSCSDSNSNLLDTGKFEAEAMEELEQLGTLNWVNQYFKKIKQLSQ